MLLRKRIHGVWLAPLQPDGTQLHLNTEVHTLHDYDPDLDPMIAHRASKMVENEEKTQFHLLVEKPPTLTFQEALNNDSTDMGPVPCRDKQQRAPKVAASFSVAS